MGEYIESYIEKGKLVISVKGDIDAYHSAEFKKGVKEKMSDSDMDVVLILDGVPYIDSAGLGTLVSILRDIRTQGKNLYLVGLKNNVKKIFEMTRLDKVFKIYDTLEEVLEVD